MKLLERIGSYRGRQRRVKRLLELKAKYVGTELAFEPPQEVRALNEQRLNLRPDFKYVGPIVGLHVSGRTLWPEVDIQGARFFGPALEETLDA